MGLPTEVLKAWEACDRTDTLFVLVCSVFCTFEQIPHRSQSIAAFSTIISIARPLQRQPPPCHKSPASRVFSASLLCIPTIIDKLPELTQPGWGIIPAVGIAYSGYTTRSNSLAAVIPSILAVIVCSIQWFLIGYTLTILFSFFQLVFQATVCAIAVGGACERGRILPLIPFIFVSVPTRQVLRGERVLTQYPALVYICL
jgi:hypothetical protein